MVGEFEKEEEEEVSWVVRRRKKAFKNMPIRCKRLEREDIL